MGALQAPKPAVRLPFSWQKNTGRRPAKREPKACSISRKKIHDYIKERGKATREEIVRNLNIPDWELEKQIVVLRHCELVKGRKEEDKVYLVLFDR